ncbi:uncharacterized protein PAC_19324 [Phialocephala subalpina]|uniref:Uncharacterized protein n=1 Tax=Phialocephala subalpina TaxID=576137 RepID=A0A1L7XWK7_9HELO|nr:uncharacterized protein PAC_19324 [Phialocephala subalpina]
MTLVFTDLGQLIQTQFGVNEIASMLTIGKAIGSVVTRQSDASIFQPLAAQYNLRISRLPSWLRDVSLDREGTILGDRQRRVQVQSAMACVDINSIEGLATFLILILRYVESAADIVEDVENLLRGDYEIVSGGDLKDFKVVDGNIEKESLPFSLRNVLRSFVNGVIDADATSNQRNVCMTLMTELAGLVGSAKFTHSPMGYVKMEHQKVLVHVFNSGEASTSSSMEILNSLSAGAAMIGLAAAANGANVVVEVIKNDHVTILKPKNRPAKYERETPRIIRLWLSQPPSTILKNLSPDGLNAWDKINKGGSELLPLPIYGGMLEISSHVAKNFSCGHSTEVDLALWKVAVLTGQQATWVSMGGPDKKLAFALTNEYLHSHIEIPASLTRLADHHYRVPRGDRRHDLARKAASVLHEVLRYTDYSDFNPVQFNASVDLINVALMVGFLQSFIGNVTSRMMAYAWTVDCDRTLGLVEKCTDTGINLLQIITQASRIWGGITSRYLELSRSTSRDGNGDASMVLGIICPQIIFVSNILLDPKAVAENAITEGLLSWCEGSSPMLPRELNSGFIMAGHPSYRKPSLTINANESIPEDEDQGEEDFDPLIFSIEPCSTSMGSLGMVLCAWHLGDLMMVLDPGVVLTNLLRRRSMTVGPETQPRQATHRIIHMSPKFLQWLECGFVIQNGAAVIDARGKSDWQVIAAGVVAAPRVVFLSEALDMSLALSPSVGLQHGFVYVLSGALEEDEPPKPETHVEVRDACNSATSNPF